MELGMIGLGRMGANMVERLLAAGHNVVVYDRDTVVLDRAAEKGARAAPSIADLVNRLQPPRAIWLMLPAGDAVEQTVNVLASALRADDIVVDGGNSNYKDAIKRSSMLAERGIPFLDVGTSGGIWGLDLGYCLMIGGDAAAVDRLRPVFESLAPAADRGWSHVGPSGAGHFVKMIHNGIEYGLMQAYAEGFSLLHRKEDFHLDLHQVAELWRHGSVIRSWLLDLTTDALSLNPTMEGIPSQVGDSGEGRWTVAESIELNVSAPVITMSLLERLRSRDVESFASRLLAVMRNKFGGHEVNKT